MWLLLIVAVALIWLIGQSQGGGNADSVDYSGGGLADLLKLPSGLPGAVAQVESGNRQYDANGNPIISSAGAIGIMQLEPATAADLGVDPYDPAQNVEGGTRYLQQLYNQFGGNPENTLAAYNWGPGNVERALQTGQPFPASVMQYVRNVLAIFNRQGGVSA